MDYINHSRWARSVGQISNAPRLLLALSAAACVGLQLFLKDISNATLLLNAVPSLLIAFTVTYILERKYKVLNKLFEIRSKKAAIISVIITSFTLWEIASGFFERWFIFITQTADKAVLVQLRNALSETALELAFIIVLVAICIIASFFVYSIVYALVSRLSQLSIANLWKKTCIIERIYFIAATIIFGCVIAYTTSQSTAFFTTDAIYNMDSGSEYYGLYFGREGSESVVRFYFQLISAPIALAAGVVDTVFFFIPYPPGNYVILLCNSILVTICGILLSRLCEAKGISKICYLLCYTLSYPFVIFSLTIDKYVISTLYVILLVYTYLHKPKIAPVAAQAAAGAMTTNIVFFPILSYDRSIKVWLAGLCKYALAFAAIGIFCGQFTIITTSVDKLTGYLGSFAGKGVSLSDRALQYLNFVSSCFIKPDIAINHSAPGSPGYELAQSAAVNILGILILVLATAGFIVNRRNRFAQLAGFWCLFSFVILFVIGWQSALNEMFLCTLYFGWAFFSLTFMLIEKLFSKRKIIQHIICFAAFAAMAVINIIGLVDLIDYAATYYPIL